MGKSGAFDSKISLINVLVSILTILFGSGWLYVHQDNIINESNLALNKSNFELNKANSELNKKSFELERTKLELEKANFQLSKS